MTHLPLAIRYEAHLGDRVVRCFEQRPSDLNAMLRQTVERWPLGEALVCGERRLDWTATRERVMRLASGLVQRGVMPGDRVALLLGNDIEFVLTTFAAIAVGAIAVPLSIRDQRPGIAYILQNCGAKVLVHDSELADRIPPAAELPDLLHRVVVGGACQGAESFESLADAAPLAECMAVSQDDVAVIMYTSGTTGFPKGAMLTHLNIVHSVMHYAQGLRLGDQERGCAVVPLSHVTGLVGLMMVMAGTGGTLLILPGFKAKDYLAFAARERVTFTVMVPAMYNLCLLQPDFNQYDLSAWRVGGYGGAPMPTASIDALALRLPQLALSNCYGATETASPAVIMPAQFTRTRPDSVGLALSCAEIAVMDGDGRELPRGGVGELWLKGPMVAHGYWKNPEATAANFLAGYWRSGDVGSMDEEGFVQILDRQKDMLNRGGYKIYSAEVENVLTQHPDVLEAAVVAKPCPVLGERVHAFVAARAGHALNMADLTAFCASRLSDYKVPESFTLNADPLPRNANGKLMKRELRERLLATTP